MGRIASVYFYRASLLGSSEGRRRERGREGGALSCCTPGLCVVLCCSGCAVVGEGGEGRAPTEWRRSAVVCRPVQAAPPDPGPVRPSQHASHPQVGRSAASPAMSPRTPPPGDTIQHKRPMSQACSSTGRMIPAECPSHTTLRDFSGTPMPRGRPRAASRLGHLRREDQV